MASPIPCAGDLRSRPTPPTSARWVRLVINPIWNACGSSPVHANGRRAGSFRTSATGVLDRPSGRTRRLVRRVGDRMDAFDIAEFPGGVLAFLGALNNWASAGPQRAVLGFSAG